MSEAYLTSFSFGNDAGDSRNQFHQIALREARIATEHHATREFQPAQPSFATRLRLVFGGRPTAQPAACLTCAA